DLLAALSHPRAGHGLTHCFATDYDLYAILALFADLRAAKPGGKEILALDILDSLWNNPLKQEEWPALIGVERNGKWIGVEKNGVSLRECFSQPDACRCRFAENVAGTPPGTPVEVTLPDNMVVNDTGWFTRALADFD